MQKSVHRQGGCCEYGELKDPPPIRLVSLCPGVWQAAGAGSSEYRVWCPRDVILRHRPSKPVRQPHMHLVGSPARGH
eukprot:15431401-Alexandrium_andersonii.AAC.1